MTADNRRSRIYSGIPSVLLGIVVIISSACSDKLENSIESNTDSLDTETVDTSTIDSTLDSEQDTFFTQDTDTDTAFDTESAADSDACAQQSMLEDRLVCVHAVESQDVWTEISFPVFVGDQLSEGKYIIAATTESAIPVTFVNVNSYSLHFDLLSAVYPDQFQNVSPVQYLQMATDGMQRSLIVGSIRRYDDGGNEWFGFTVLDDAAGTQCITFEQVEYALTALQSVFFAPLRFVPETVSQLEAVSDWPDVPWVHNPTALSYEVYNAAAAYGTIRFIAATDLLELTSTGDIGYTDILVLDEAPVDIERVVSGMVTGTRQGMLSHLNVRSMARNTPNCYVRFPIETLAEFENKLVRFECGVDTYTIEDATLDDAQQFWDDFKPESLTVPSVDTEETRLQLLDEVPVATASERQNALAAYGAKGTNLAILYHLVDMDMQLKGFLIPFSYYQRFISEQSWIQMIDGESVSMTFAETLDLWLTDASFLTDTALRNERLNALRQAMEGSSVSQTDILEIGNRVEDVFGNTTTMVRFRSSSNAEDSLQFNGAGLYDSTSACPADEVDDDSDGPCLCDVATAEERDLRRALTKVWASLWSAKAFEEREWYGIDHRAVKMAILVNTRTQNEQANIVAFSGDPGKAEEYYVVNAQAGELDVVSSLPGVYPETTYVHVNDDSSFSIDRIAASSEVDDGQMVLSDTHLEDIAAVLQMLTLTFPVDVASSDSEYFLDTEWKLNEDGQLIIKQIRPFPR